MNHKTNKHKESIAGCGFQNSNRNASIAEDIKEKVTTTFDTKDSKKLLAVNHSVPNKV